MKKWVCPVCGYVHEGDVPPEFCPQCKVPGSKFTEMKAEMTWAAEHVVGVGKTFGADVPADVQEKIIEGLRANFTGECTEVGMYPVSYTHLQAQPGGGVAAGAEGEAGIHPQGHPALGVRLLPVGDDDEPLPNLHGLVEGLPVVLPVRVLNAVYGCLLYTSRATASAGSWRRP